jgi:hypothetical protein
VVLNGFGEGSPMGGRGGKSYGYHNEYGHGDAYGEVAYGTVSEEDVDGAAKDETPRSAKKATAADRA